MNHKHALFAAVVCSAAFSLAEATYDAESVPGSLIVIVDGGEATLDVARVTEDITTIVKRGAGNLLLQPLASYRGDFSFEAGTVTVDRKYDLGADNTGVIYLRDGATIVNRQSTGGWGDYIGKGKTLYVSGAPAPGYDAKFGRWRTPESKDWFLDASRHVFESDATVMACAQRLKLRNLIDLGGHTLRFDVSNSWSQIQVDCMVTNGGHVVYHGGNSLTLENTPGAEYQNEGGTFGFYPADGVRKLTVTNTVFGMRSGVKANGATLELANAKFHVSSNKAFSPADAATYRWDGPVEVIHRAWLGNNTSTNTFIGIGGPVSGSGDLYLGPGSVSFANAGESTFSGSVHVAGDVTDKVRREKSGVRLEDGGAFFPAASSVAFADGANLWMERSDAANALPALTFGGEFDQTVSGGGNAFSANGRPTVVSLAKSGSGTLRLDCAVAVTGAVEIAGGTLSIPRVCGHAGLMEGWYVDPTVDDQVIWSFSDSVLDKLHDWSYDRYGPTRIFDGYKCDKSDGHTHATIYAYQGYIWNRTAEEKTVQFAMHLTYRGSFRLNGKWLGSAKEGSAINVFTAVLKPGANPFVIASLSARWFSDQKVDTKRFDGLGLSWDPNPTVVNGVVTTNVANFVRLDDGGSGELFTIDDDATASGAGDLLPQFASLAMDAGTTLALNGGDFLQGDFAGVTSIAGEGTFTITNRWTLRERDFLAGQPLVSQGALAFADGAELDVGGFRNLPASVRNAFLDGIPVATAEKGVLSVPAVSDGDRKAGLRLSLSDDGKSLVAKYCPHGMIFMLH